MARRASVVVGKARQVIEARPYYPLAAFSGEPPPRPRWFVEALAQQPDRQWIDVDGVRIEALSWGRVGDPGVLFLHGAMANAEWWCHLGPILAQDRRVTAISTSGMGGSDWRDVYTMDGHAREALVAAEQTGLFASEVRPSVVAHSFGGHVLLRMAAHWGGRFERAVVIDSMAGSPINPPRHSIKAGAFPTVAHALARFRLLPGQAAEPFILDWFGRRGLKEISLAGGQPHYVWCFDPDFFVKFEPFEDQPYLAMAKCPLVFVRGEDSGVCTPAVEAHQRLAAPRSTRFLSIPGASHHIMADQPLRLGETLGRLLSRAAPNALQSASL